ncbi:hypothetical protein GOBAR_AA26461 [Gossypium barbadense]|uniref:Uncharacterized protein n=1 Tax=Gossypium barbadense TaxID=3634 RepID=A0A2P5WT05_GOSBA|nr:hypothetical protein GOBAR_AA26461 [Gossypium barbadense]
MDSNNGSPATMSVSMTESFKFNGKWASLVLLLVVMLGLIISATVYKCKRGCADVVVETEVELGHGIKECNVTKNEVQEIAEDQLPYSLVLKVEPNLLGKETMQMGGGGDDREHCDSFNVGEKRGS